MVVNSLRRPRIEGTFRGERMRAFDVVWGAVTGRAVIENSYADVSNVAILAGDSAIHVDGRFSLGYPRRDGGEEQRAQDRDDADDHEEFHQREAAPASDRSSVGHESVEVHGWDFNSGARWP